MPTKDLQFHSRRVTITPTTLTGAARGMQILSVDAGADSTSTWIAHVQHNGDAPTAVVNIDGLYTGPSGTVSTISTELGSREGMSFCFTSAITLHAACPVAVSLDVWCTKAMALVPFPPFRHTTAVTNAAYVTMSPSSGFAPSNRRWFGIMSDANGTNYDIQIREGTSGNLIWESLNNGPGPVFRQILPPGCRLSAKTTVTPNANLTCTWTQYHSQ